MFCKARRTAALLVQFLEVTRLKPICQTWEKDGFLLRPAREEDAEDYFRQNFNPLDPELARLTGCKSSFTREEVVTFFRKCVQADDRFDFLLFAPDGRIIGESVINEIDLDLRCANFRICIFHASERGQGIGSWMVAATRDFAFDQLKLHRLSLDVYSFNPRAEAVYRKAGFRREGVLRDAVRDGDRYGDDILMALLEDEWRELCARPGL